MDVVSLAEKFALFADHWRPKVVGSLNGQEVKLVKVKGVFPWHTHQDIDELFMVWKGRFRVEFRDRIAELCTGDLIIVPRGVEHRTAADEEAEVLIFEPAEVRNKGRRRRCDVHRPSGRGDLTCRWSLMSLKKLQPGSAVGLIRTLYVAYL